MHDKQNLQEYYRHKVSLGGNHMLGFYARSLRTYLGLSPKELAKLAKVSPKSVYLFERNQPLELDDKRKIMSELYKRKISTVK